MNWTTYIRLLYTLTLDADVFGADPLLALDVIGMALERTHAGMSREDSVFVDNVIGFYRERLEVERIAA